MRLNSICFKKNEKKNRIDLKWTVVDIKAIVKLKIGKLNSQWYPLNLYTNTTLEDIDVF